MPAWLCRNASSKSSINRPSWLVSCLTISMADSISEAVAAMLWNDAALAIGINGRRSSSARIPKNSSRRRSTLRNCPVRVSNSCCSRLRSAANSRACVPYNSSLRFASRRAHPEFSPQGHDRASQQDVRGHGDVIIGVEDRKIVTRCHEKISRQGHATYQDQSDGPTPASHAVAISAAI